MKLFEVIDQYVHSRSFKSLAASSKRQYSEVLTKFELRYGMNEIDTIKRSDIVGMLDDLSLIGVKSGKPLSHFANHP